MITFFDMFAGVGGFRAGLERAECFRLQGFTNEQIDNLLDGSSDAQAYKQAGNAVTINVVHSIALRLKTAYEATMAATATRLEAA